MTRDGRILTRRHRFGSLRALALGLAWVGPWLTGFLLFFLVPIAASLALSFTDYAMLDAPVGVGVDNYRELFSDDLFRAALGNTAWFAIGSVAGGTVVSVALAVLLERCGRGVGIARAVVFLPTLVPPVASCMAWLWLFNPRSGLINSVLSRVGVVGPDWLGDRTIAMPSLVFMSLWVIGSPLVVCSAALRDVPVSLYEAADLDGASGWRRFRHVTLPLISPGVLFNAVMSIIWSLQLFAPPLIMTRGGPEHATLSVAMSVYNNAFAYGRMGYACAMAWVQTVITLVLAVLALRLSRRFVYYRAA